MKFEKLNYSSGNVKKAFVIGIVVTLLFIIIINLFFTKAKYKLVESRKLASGTINYTLVDFELAGIKFKANGSQDYGDVSTIENNYEFNQEMSYCTEKYSDDSDNFKDVRNNNLTINFDKENKTISVKPYSKKGTKCYLFFDEKELPSLNETVIAQSTGKGGTFTGPSCSTCTVKENGIYTGEDDFGTSYVYRGTVDNNWVVFGKDTSDGDKYIWWRIIRINGNGTIRLIYAGTNNSTTDAPPTTGNETMINPKTPASSINLYAMYFNQTANDNKYVGYMYPGQKGSASTDFNGAHKVDSNSTESEALTQIKQWYQQDTNLGTLAAQYIDTDTGFCSDSSLAKGKHGDYTGDGIGTRESGYAGLDKVWQSGVPSVANTQTPTLKCGYDVINKQLNKTAQKRDLYTGPNATSGGIKGSNGTNVEGNNALPVPVGLITMDEVIYAGGFYGQTNANYWLKTDKTYWTMSPSYFSSTATLFIVNSVGNLVMGSVNSTGSGARPVINLKANVKITGTGSSDDPYVVETS